MQHHDSHVAVCSECPELPYLSLTVPKSDDSLHLHVRRVVFTIESHDQGWSDSDPSTHGSYAESFTYFETLAVDSVKHSPTARCEVQRNIHARRVPNIHIITWDHRDAAGSPSSRMRGSVATAESYDLG